MSLESLFEQYTGSAPVSSVALTGSASHRRYYRLTGADGRTLIGVEGTDPDENRAFLTIDRHFAAKGINVPKVVAVDGLCYLQEDLGSTILYDALAAGRSSGHYSPEEVALLRKTLAALPKIQVEGARGLDFSVCYPQPSFDARMVDFDLNYFKYDFLKFKYDFLKLVGLEFNEVFLQDDFDRLKADLLAEPSDTFLYRDFNARNVMLVDGEPYFIDFQGGRRGPVYYDVASFLWQARAKYPEALREELLQVYLDALRAYGPVDEVHFRQRLRLFILFRMLQVLGCYGYRSRFSAATATVASGKATKPSPPASPRPSRLSNPFCRSTTIPTFPKSSLSFAGATRRRECSFPNLWPPSATLEGGARWPGTGQWEGRSNLRLRRVRERILPPEKGRP